MKDSFSSFWPRGLPAGALLAAMLIVPAFVVMMFDASAGTARPDAPGRFSHFSRPLPLRASSAFFDGRLEVQAVLTQRFAAYPTEKPVNPTGTTRDPKMSSQASETVRPGLLRLRLENRSEQNIEVAIVRVDSDLGEFHARPDRLMLAPDQAATIDSPVAGPRITARSVPVAVALRVADEVETKKLVLNDHALARAGD